jgi:hypothetical protein
MKKVLLLLLAVLVVGCGTTTPRLHYPQETMWKMARPLYQNKNHRYGFFLYPDSNFVTYVPRKGCMMNYELYDNDYLYIP